ncbi:hypothetical protein Y032_0009g630 [Ancylostoma ceylanicum]|uniref:Reverse transcriptase domain-containing protein n=1 Tax=Ancylostoma ceylanicum TaxID=53326 RepID=A0A016VIN2_9BILA|nr:hypothetical protein Y032_0009g630 [Ancylostoma ceylanicum]
MARYIGIHASCDSFRKGKRVESRGVVDSRKREIWDFPPVQVVAFSSRKVRNPRSSSFGAVAGDVFSVEAQRWWKFGFSWTVLIFKKGDKEEIENYRPIALLSIPYKVFTKIILNRLEGTLDAYQPTEQAGFRKGFCCMDHIHTETQLIERCREYTMPLILTFVDYRKAFDSVETNAVLNALIHAGVDPAYVNILEQCNIGTTTTIQLFDKKLQIPIEKGVDKEILPRQNCSRPHYNMPCLD